MVTSGRTLEEDLALLDELLAVTGEDELQRTQSTAINGVAGALRNTD